MMFKNLYPFKIPPTPIFSFYLVKKIYFYICLHQLFYTHIHNRFKNIHIKKKSPHLKHEIGCKQN